MKKKWSWGIGCLLLLGLGFWVCRYLLLDWHGMKQWAEFLAVLAAAVIAAASVFDARFVSAASAAGYVGGCLIGKLLFRLETGPGGGRHSNYWLIWTAAFGICILTALAAQILWKRRNERKNRLGSF